MLISVRTCDDKVVDINPAAVASVQETRSVVTISMVNGQEYKVSARIWMLSDLRFRI